MTSSDPTVRLVVTCIGAPRCVVTFEPEGASVDLVEGARLMVEICGPGDGVAEVSYSDDGISIAAWNRAVTAVWDNEGEQLKI